MRRFTLVILSLLMTACGQSNLKSVKRRVSRMLKSPVKRQRIYDGIDSSFAVQANFFEQRFQRQITVPINFGDTGDSLAVCQEYSSGEKEIFVNEKSWNQMTQASRLALILHELGHCMFNRKHNDTELQYIGNIPVSIMNPGNFYLSFDNWELWEVLFKELETGDTETSKNTILEYLDLEEI